jgi:predicted transcriptional regulator
MEIISDMLVIILQKNGSIKPTRLMYKANLSHKQMKEYLDELQKKDLVFKDSSGQNGKNGNRGISIKLTGKGKDFLFKYMEMREFEKTFGL